MDLPGAIVEVRLPVCVVNVHIDSPARIWGYNATERIYNAGDSTRCRIRRKTGYRVKRTKAGEQGLSTKGLTRQDPPKNHRIRRQIRRVARHGKEHLRREQRLDAEPDGVDEVD
jgi:hypothetical protein